jgi:hypothetical protein
LDIVQLELKPYGDIYIYKCDIHFLRVHIHVTIQLT